MLPLWHNRLFAKSSGRTYYSPSLIRKNVILLRDIIQRPELCEALAHTWKYVYRLHKRKLLSLRNPHPHNTSRAELLVSLAIFCCFQGTCQAEKFLHQTVQGHMEGPHGPTATRLGQTFHLQDIMA